MATETFELAILGGTIVNQDGAHTADIGVREGRIAHIGVIRPEQAARAIAAHGLHVLPGVIDTQVHFREPGPTHKEDLETGARAAVLGGVTAVFEMPNTKPETTSEAALADKIARASGRMACDFAFFVGATRENASQLGELERLPGAAGVKVFAGSSTGDLLVEDEPSLARVLAAVSRRVAFHSEDEPRLRARMDLRRPGDPSSHGEWRDAEAAMISTERLVRLARAAGKRIHILHVSTAEEMRFLAGHKDFVSVEATPQHLTLSSDDYATLGARLQQNPPIRDAAHRDALWTGVEQGVVDVIGSDHAPHTPEEKAAPYPGSPSGMPGVQTLVPIMLDHVNAGRLSLARFVDLTSAGPQRLFGIAGKGRIAAGYDADFTVVDLKRRETIRNDRIASRAGWTPYDGREVTGWPVGTLVRGHVAMWEGDAFEARGAPVRFGEALPR
jgi:dihydroorotase